MDSPLLQELNWPSAVTLLGAISIVAGTLYRFFKKDYEWKQPMKELEMKINDLDSRVDKIDEKVTSNNQFIEREQTKLQNEIERTERKVEKMTEMLMKYINETNKD